MDFDQTQQRLDPEMGVCRDPFVTGPIDPDNGQQASPGGRYGA